MKKIVFKKTACIFLATVIAVVSMTACDGSNKMENEIPPYPVTVNSVTIEKAPKAVASLSSTLTNMIVDLGFLTKIVGFSNGEILPDLPPVIEPVSSDTGFRWFWEPKPEPPKEPEVMQPNGEIGTALEPNYEKIGEYLPEIIFTTLPLPNAQMEKLSAVNIKVIVVPMPKSLEELKQNYIAVYRAMAGQVEADKMGTPIVTEISRQLSHIQSVAQGNKKSVLYVEDTVPIIATADSYEGSIIALLAENIAGEAKNYTLTPEELTKLAPDIILYSEGIDPEFFNQNEAFKEKAAVKNGQVLSIDKNLFFDTRLTLSESIIKIAETIYPGVDFKVPEPVSSEVSSKSSKK